LYICKKIVIAKDKLHIKKLKAHFKGEKSFDTAQISAFYRQFDRNIKQTTINWRIYQLVKKGVLKRISRGKFAFGEGRRYIPEVSAKMTSINKKLKAKFPYINICIWNTSALNEFMTHQPGYFYTLVEVDREAIEPVFYYLKDLKYQVFINPTQDILEKYMPKDKEVIILKPLISQAPLLNIKGVKTTTLEKMLVDVFSDKILFSAQQGSEMRTIFKNAFDKYTVNRSSMLRYSDRRRKKEQLKKYLY